MRKNSQRPRRTQTLYSKSTTTKSSESPRVSLKLTTLDEVPIVLNELNDSSIKYMSKEQYEKALILLQKAQGIIQVVSLEKCKRDKFFAFVVFHNMAACF